MLKKVMIFSGRAHEAGYPVPSCRAEGDVSGRRDVAQSQWVAQARLSKSSGLAWDTRHGDEVMYVLSGELQVDGRPCGPGGVIAIEAGTAAKCTATEDTEIIHFGPVSSEPPSTGPLGAPDRHGHCVHVIPYDDAIHTGTTTEEGTHYGLAHYLDSTCKTCRATIFGVIVEGDAETPLHSHSVDEIIHVLEGELKLGNISIGPGMSVAIQHDQRYGFHSSGTLKFLNYRNDVSYITTTLGSEPTLETVAHRQSTLD